MFPSLTDNLNPKGSLGPPAAVSGATWQAGVTPLNERYKVALDGEPVPLAIAASIRKGWVMVYVVERDKLKTAGGTAVVRTLRGHVEVIPGDRY